MNTPLSTIVSNLVACGLACMVATPVVADMSVILDGFGGPRGYGDSFLDRNDDGSTGALGLPFEINFFGNVYSQYIVNNNGNISFTQQIGEYTPSAQRFASQPIIAPYWADVDTSQGETPFPEGGVGDTEFLPLAVTLPGDPGNLDNLVWFTAPDADTLIVTWDEVGYYYQHTDKRNTFQLVLHNRADTGTGNFDIEFRYGKLEWTTGDASDGIDGFGGTPALAGYDAANGWNYEVLPGSLTGGVLDLQHTSNVGTLGLWRFEVRNSTMPGETPSNPVLPDTLPQPGEPVVYTFEDMVVEGFRPIFIDPLVAVGYDYEVGAGPNFASVTLPNFGDAQYELWLWDGSQWVFQTMVSAGVVHQFTDGGVSRFRILGIETSAALDPNDPTAFITGVSFVEDGIVTVSQTPISIEAPIPEPQTWAMMLAGLGLIGMIARRQRG